MGTLELFDTTLEAFWTYVMEDDDLLEFDQGGYTITMRRFVIGTREIGDDFVIRLSFREDSIGLSWGFEETTFRPRKIWWYGESSYDYQCSSFSCHHEPLAECPQSLEIVIVDEKELVSTIVRGVEMALSYAKLDAPQPIDELDIMLLMEHLAKQWQRHPHEDLCMKQDAGGLVWVASNQAEILSVFSDQVDGRWQVNLVSTIFPAVDISTWMSFPRVTTYAFKDEGECHPVDDRPISLRKMYEEVWDDVEYNLTEYLHS